MIFEREGSQYRVSMERREALDLIARLSEAVGKSIGAFPVATISTSMIEKDGKNGYARVLLVTVDPDLHEPNTARAKENAKRRSLVRRGPPRSAPQAKARPK